MFIIIGISPIVIIVLGAAAILVLGAHITAGLILAAMAIAAGSLALTTLGVVFLHHKYSQPVYNPPQYRLAQGDVLTALVTPGQPQEAVWPSRASIGDRARSGNEVPYQPRLAIAQPLNDEQMQATAVYILNHYRERASLANLEAIDEGRINTHD